MAGFASPGYVQLCLVSANHSLAARRWRVGIPGFGQPFGSSTSSRPHTTWRDSPLLNPAIRGHFDTRRNGPLPAQRNPRLRRPAPTEGVGSVCNVVDSSS